MAFPWYDICKAGNETLEQGDFIENCPIVIPPKNISENDTPDIEIQEIDSVILSQSCDLDHGKISLVLVCPYMNLKEWLCALPEDRNKTPKAKKKTIDKLKQGALPGYHLLNKDDESGFGDYQVVDFKNVYGINFDLLKNIITHRSTPRIRLLSPYKEHLSQSFARYFMRVGLPNDIRVEGYY